jgi:hypothetical protein
MFEVCPSSTLDQIGNACRTQIQTVLRQRPRSIADGFRAQCDVDNGLPDRKPVGNGKEALRKSLQWQRIFGYEGQPVCWILSDFRIV